MNLSNAVVIQGIRTGPNEILIPAARKGHKIAEIPAVWREPKAQLVTRGNNRAADYLARQ